MNQRAPDPVDAGDGLDPMPQAQGIEKGNVEIGRGQRRPGRHVFTRRPDERDIGHRHQQAAMGPTGPVRVMSLDPRPDDGERVATTQIKRAYSLRERARVERLELRWDLHRGELTSLRRRT